MTAVVDQTARLVIRVVIIALMTLVAAVPALAESGCLEGTRGPSITTAAAAASSITRAGNSEEDGKTSLGEGVVHCAFSHCAHGVPAAPPEQDASLSDYPALVYTRSVAQRLLDATSNGPDHPPRA
jgi:hypothetical protein